MQTNTLQIDSWDALYTMFTTLEPLDRRMAVLQVIADPSTTIGHRWSDCLFAVAARAAGCFRLEFAPVEAADALGIPIQWVADGVRVWDQTSVWDETHVWRTIKVSKKLRELATSEFRRRIQAHLKGLEKTPEAADEAVSEARQATRFVEKVKRSFRELTRV